MSCRRSAHGRGSSRDTRWYSRMAIIDVLMPEADDIFVGVLKFDSWAAK